MPGAIIQRLRAIGKKLVGVCTQMGGYLSWLAWITGPAEAGEAQECGPARAGEWRWAGGRRGLCAWHGSQVPRSRKKGRTVVLRAQVSGGGRVEGAGCVLGMDHRSRGGGRSAGLWSCASSEWRWTGGRRGLCAWRGPQSTPEREARRTTLQRGRVPGIPEKQKGGPVAWQPARPVLSCF